MEQKDFLKKKKMRLSEVKELYRNSKDSNLVNLYAAGIHQLLNIQLLYFDYIEDILAKWGLLAHGVKHSLGICKRAFNDFERQLQQNIKTREQQDDFNYNFERLYEALTNFFTEPEPEPEQGQEQEQNNLKNIIK
jgi:hypothetical protein